ncbi:TRAF3-interacting JNK-activating modulator isoform X1 [Anolis carolinensis]|uniref:TRAF3-interacting JNK-activating modulator isoform X1 n=1 Tax=Anolis carolinensis TaxID=28377 RepID=UPI002F2B365D
MLSRFCQSHIHRRPHPESYEEKYERLQERHEVQLKRKSWTSSHLKDKHQRKGTNMQLQNPRQKEFLRRRNVRIEELGMTEVPPLSDTKTSLITEESWSNQITQLHHKAIQCDLSDIFVDSKLDSSENKLAVEVSRNSRGTQTTVESSAVKKNSSQQTDCEKTVVDKEVTQLSIYIEEALYRELLLKRKMVNLQGLLSNLYQVAEKSWKDYLNEDKLKDRVDNLTNQLLICSQKYSERNLQRVILDLEDQKQNYQQKMKESLQKLLQEKLQLERQLENVQRNLAIVQEECTLWKEQCNILKQDWSQQPGKHAEQENKLYILENKLQQPETQNSQLHQNLQDLESECTSLSAKPDNVKEDNRLSVENLSAVENRLQTQEKESATIKYLHDVMHNQSKEIRIQQNEL